MSYSTFRLEQDGAILRVTLSNPPVNTMSSAMAEELLRLSERLAEDASVNVVVFDSADPDFFIAHFDLNDLVAAVSDPVKANESPEINFMQALTLAWQALPQVTIAKVKGRCRGAGLEFLLCLDLRLAGENARFCLPEASAGFLASGSGATRVALMAGHARALEVLLSARDFSASEAERYGLINQALSADALDEYTEDLIGRLSKRSRSVIAMNKKVLACVHASAGDVIRAGFAAENSGLQAALGGSELKMVIAAMLSLGQSREVELDLPASLSRLVAGQTN